MDNCLSSQHIVHAGWLIKSPPEKRIWKTKWRRRWFVLKLSGQIPGQYVLEYFIDQSCKKLKGTIDLDQCEQVDAGLQLEIRKENYEHMFDVRTPRRIYYLVAKNEEEMNKWVECVCAVCGLKMEPSDLSLLPPAVNELNDERYSPQPSQTEQQQHQNSQLQLLQQQNQLNNNSSTSESSLATLNYIPISECYTGKASRCERGGSSPPPRPPKPIGLGAQSTMEKSQSSLALWPYESETAAESNCKIIANNILNGQPLPGSNDRSLYLNSSPPNHTGQSVSPHSMYDTWHPKTSSSRITSKTSFTATRPNIVNNSTFFVQPPKQTTNQNQNSHVLQQNQNQAPPPPPPMVNRDLKPQRRKFIDSNSSEFQRISSSLNRHTLPRPPTAGNSMRIAIQNNNESGEKLHNSNNNNNHNNNNGKLLNSHSVLAEHKKLSFPGNNSQQNGVTGQQPISLPLSAINANNNNNNNNFLNESSNEIQYLDLDLDSESTNSQSPRTPLTTASDNNNSVNNNNNLPTSNATLNVDGQFGHSNVGVSWNLNTNSNIPLNSGNLQGGASLSASLADAYNNNTNGQISNLNHPNAGINNNTLQSTINNNNNNQQQPLPQNHSSTVYKKVDFVKTKAFNEMRVNVDLYRNGQ